jgi:hypothetical protein
MLLIKSPVIHADLGVECSSVLNLQIRNGIIKSTVCPIKETKK